MFRYRKKSPGDGRVSAGEPERAAAEWARIDRMLEARPLPQRCPDVRADVLARIQAERIRHLGWRRWLTRPLLSTSAWGLAGAVAGLLFLSLLATPASSSLDVVMDSEVAAAPLMTDDLVILTRMTDVYGTGERP